MLSTFKKFTAQPRLKIANNPNFVSTSIHCSAATARMKTNLLEDNISIQFEGEPCRRTPRVHQIVAENFAFFVVLDGLTYFLVQYFKHVLYIVDDKHASLQENQIVVLSDLVLLLLCLKLFFVLFASYPFFRCSFTRMVFQGKCVVLSDFLFCPTFVRQRLLAVCICVPSFQNNWHEPIFGSLAFSIYHVLCHTLFDALIDHAQDLRMCSSLLRIQESTMSHICLCCIVDSLP